VGIVLVVWTTSACGALSLSTVGGVGQKPGVDVPSGPGEVARAPLGAPPLAPPGTGGYAFTMTHDDGSPVTFDPCRAVHYVVRPAGEPKGGLDLVHWAFGQLSTATGLQFVDDGATDEAPSETRAPYQPARYGDRWAPVLVTWSSPTETSMLTSGVLGRAGPDTFATSKDSDRFVSGLAVFDGAAINNQLRTGDESKARAVLLHELGHLVGLAHVTDPYQVMYDTNAYPLAEYRAGDLRGLGQLGRGRCFRDR
jgi:hypothetical protein